MGDPETTNSQVLTVGSQVQLELDQERKVIIKRMQLEVPRDLGILQFQEYLNEAYFGYRARLQNAGIIIPGNISLEVSPIQDDEQTIVQVTSVDTFVPGTDLFQQQRWIEDSGFNSDETLTRINLIWKDILDHLYMAHLHKVPLDGKPENFVRTNDDSIFYVDFFPPLVTNLEGGLDIRYLEKMFPRGRDQHNFILNDIRGMVTKQIERIANRSKGGIEVVNGLLAFTVDYVRQYSAETGESNAAYIIEQLVSSLPDIRTLYRGDQAEIEALLTRLAPSNH